MKINALTDTARVIITKAYMNANVVPSQEVCGVSSSRSYHSAVRAFIKNDWVKTTGGLKGMAQEGDYATPDGHRLFFTQAFLDEFYGLEDSIPAIVPNHEEDMDDTTAIVDVVEMVEETEEEDEDNRSSKVASKYKKGYAELRATGGSGQGCNDAIDRWMYSTFMTKTKVVRTVTTKKGTQRQVTRNVLRLDREAIVAFANENNIFAPKYLTLNNGMLRMDIANQVRRVLAKGTNIKHKGKIVLRGTPVAKKAA